MPIHAGEVADEVLHAVCVVDDEQIGGQAADVFFALEGERGFAPVGLHLLHAGRDKGADADDAPDFGHELALLQCLL